MPRSSASHELRGRIETLASVSCITTPPGEHEVGAHQQPQRCADDVFDRRCRQRHGGPIGFDERGDQQEGGCAADQLDAVFGCQAQCLRASSAARRQQCCTELQPGSAGEGDGRQLERTMADDERPEWLVVADARQVAGYCADGQAVEEQEEQGPQAEQQPAGERLKAMPMLFIT